MSDGVDASTGHGSQRPPVNEVVLSVAVDSTGDFVAPKFAQILGPLAEKYSIISVVPPYRIPDVSETPYGSPPASMISSLFPEARYWFISIGGDFVVQLQRDYIALNWRRSSSDKDYVHYDLIRERFVDLLAQIEGASNAGGRLAIRQAELTYVNLIRPNEEWSNARDTGRLVRVVASDLGDVDQFNLSMTRPLHDEYGAFRGRIDLVIANGYDWEMPAPVPLLNMTINARSAALSNSDVDEALRFLDEAHVDANRLFLNSITGAARRMWGLE